MKLQNITDRELSIAGLKIIEPRAIIEVDEETAGRLLLNPYIKVYSPDVVESENLENPKGKNRPKALKGIETEDGKQL